MGFSPRFDIYLNETSDSLSGDYNFNFDIGISAKF